MNQPNDVRLRPFCPPDLTPVCRLIHDTIDACYSGIYPPRAVQFFKDFHSENQILARHNAGEVLVADHAATLVATGALVGAEILGVFVAPQFQGRGCGKAIMHRLEASAKANGQAEVVLSVSLPSIGFYQRLGYEVLQPASIEVGDGQHLHYWKAGKSLT